MDNEQIVQLGRPRGPPEGPIIRTTRQLGSLIAAALERAGDRTTDRKEALRLATESVLRVLRRGRSAENNSPRPETLGHRGAEVIGRRVDVTLASEG